MPRLLLHLKKVLLKPFCSQREQGFALIVTVLFMVIVGLFVSRNFDMVSNNERNLRSLRANSMIGKQAISTIGMAKKLLTPPWKVPCGMVGSDPLKQRWACPALFPDPFSCDESKTTIVPMMAAGANTHWEWNTSPIPHVLMRLPFIAKALKASSWQGILNGGYEHSHFASSVAIPGRLRCKRDGSGQVIQNLIDLTAISKYRENEYKQKAIFPLTPPPPKCFLSANPNSFTNKLDANEVNNEFYAWTHGYENATHNKGDKCPSGAICPPTALEPDIETRPPYFEQYEPSTITISLEAYGIFTSGMGAPVPNLGESKSLKAKITKSGTTPTPQSAPCSRVITFQYTLNYPSWLTQYLAKDANELPRWARPYAGKSNETCSTEVRFSFDSRISIAKCGFPFPPPPEIIADPGDNPTPIPGAPEDFGNGQYIGYDNDGNISVSTHSDP